MLWVENAVSLTVMVTMMLKQKRRHFASRVPRDMDEKEQWLKIIPRHNTPDTKNTVVCERHWLQGYETVKRFGKERPRYPPSVFACVKPSLQRTPAPATRAT